MARKLLAFFFVHFLLALFSVSFAETGRQEYLRGHFEGTLTATLSGSELIELRAVGAGESTLGPATAQIVWSPKTEIVRQLIAGTLDQVSLGSGQLTAKTADGSTFASPFSGVLKRLSSGQINLEGKFDISGGSVQLHGATGRGELTAVADPLTRHFSADVVIKLSRSEREIDKKEAPKEHGRGVKHDH